MNHGHQHRYGFIGWLVCTYATIRLVAMNAEPAPSWLTQTTGANQ